ncbi:helix-turn-helix domain-containing protein [Rhodococcus sp. 3Y1]
MGPIRACRTEPSIGRSPLLFWVLAGSGRVRTGSTVYEVPAGELLWIPAGVRYSMETDSDSVAFPILLPPSNGVSAGPATVTRLRVPPGWEDRLIHEFVHNLGYLRGDAAHPSSLFEMITRADDGATSLPQLPQSREAFEIAHALLRTPGTDDTEAQFAKRAGISIRTLQRYFVEETGLTFTRWRLRARIAASLEYLKQDREIGWIANEVGFETGSGFTRAFRSQMGESPSDYRRRALSGPTDRSVDTDNDQALVRMLAEPRQPGNNAADTGQCDVAARQRRPRRRVGLPRPSPGGRRGPQLGTAHRKGHDSSCRRPQYRHGSDWFTASAARLPFLERVDRICRRPRDRAVLPH